MPVKVSRLDSAGAWLLLRTRRALEAAGAKVTSFNLPELYLPLINSLDQTRKAEPHVSRHSARLSGPAFTGSAAPSCMPSTKPCRSLAIWAG